MLLGPRAGPTGGGSAACERGVGCGGAAGGRRWPKLSVITSMVAVAVAAAVVVACWRSASALCAVFTCMHNSDVCVDASGVCVAVFCTYV